MAEKADPILVAIDFSPFSERVLQWAARAAKVFSAPLLVLHVVHDLASAPGYYDRKKKHRKHLRRIEEAAAEMMSDFLQRFREQNPGLLNGFDRRLVVGLPATRILEVAAKTGAQMIVMGSRGRTGLDRLLRGSKAEKVARLSPVPVTIVKGPKASRRQRQRIQKPQAAAEIFHVKRESIRETSRETSLRAGVRSPEGDMR